MALTQNRHIDEQDRIESPKLDPCIYSQLNYNEGGKSYNRKKTASSINGGESA